jgi:hypothetical protein
LRTPSPAIVAGDVAELERTDGSTEGGR